MPHKTQNAIKLSPGTDMARPTLHQPTKQTTKNKYSFNHWVSQPFNSHLCWCNWRLVCSFSFFFSFIFKVNTFQMHLNYRNGKKMKKKKKEKRDEHNNPHFTKVTRAIILKCSIEGAVWDDGVSEFRKRLSFLNNILSNSCLIHSNPSECVSSLAQTTCEICCVCYFRLLSFRFVVCCCCCSGIFC